MALADKRSQLSSQRKKETEKNAGLAHVVVKKMLLVTENDCQSK